MWTTTADAIKDLRYQLSDGATDKLADRKTVIGICNGTNKNFKTFDIRRLSTFVSPTDIAQVFVNDTAATVDSENIESGDFVLHTAPAEGDRVTATYYHQWFNNDQADFFLRKASEWAISSDLYYNVPMGLYSAVLNKACSNAFRELAVRFARLYSAQYRMEDLPREDLKQTQDQYSNLAESYDKAATKDLEFYYTRQGLNLQPLFGNIAGRVYDVKPNR
jgi:hypothetical protein